MRLVWIRCLQYWNRCDVNLALFMHEDFWVFNTLGLSICFSPLQNERMLFFYSYVGQCKPRWRSSDERWSHLSFFFAVNFWKYWECYFWVDSIDKVKNWETEQFQPMSWNCGIHLFLNQFSCFLTCVTSTLESFYKRKSHKWQLITSNGFVNTELAI